jgi:hypothetical protein
MTRASAPALTGARTRELCPPVESSNIAPALDPPAVVRWASASSKGAPPITPQTFEQALEGEIDSALELITVGVRVDELARIRAATGPAGRAVRFGNALSPLERSRARRGAAVQTTPPASSRTREARRRTQARVRRPSSLRS